MSPISTLSIHVESITGFYPPGLSPNPVLHHDGKDAQRSEGLRVIRHGKFEFATLQPIQEVTAVCRGKSYAELAWSKTSWPTSVITIPRPCRSNRKTPSSSSKSLIWRLKAGCAMFKRSAALLRLPSSATWIRVFSWRRAEQVIAAATIYRIEINRGNHHAEHDRPIPGNSRRRARAVLELSRRIPSARSTRSAAIPRPSSMR